MESMRFLKRYNLRKLLQFAVLVNVLTGSCLTYGEETGSRADSSNAALEHASKKGLRRQLGAKSLREFSMGTESSGGGSSDRKRFYAPLSRALEKLSVQSEYVFAPKSQNTPSIRIKTEDLIAALRKVTIVPTKDQLYDRQGIKVDLYNDPNSLRISFNTKKWAKKSEMDKVQLGLHELMGILVIPDPYYSISTKLAEYALTTSKAEGLGDISVCGISVKLISYASKGIKPSDVIKDYKSEGAQVRTCQLKPAVRDRGQVATAVIGIYLDGAYALLFDDSI